MREAKKKSRGANKGRKFGKVTDEVELCWKLASGLDCQFGEKSVDMNWVQALLIFHFWSSCRFTHDLKNYLSVKPRDIKFPSTKDLSETAPFVAPPENGEIDQAFPSVDFATLCPVFEESGFCRHGLKCRFLGGHSRKIENDPGIETTKDHNREDELRSTVAELNFLGPAALKQLRTKQVCLPSLSSYKNA